MPLGLALGLGAALMWGLTDVSATFAGRRVGSLRVLAVSQTLGFTMLLVAALALGAQMPSDPRIVVTALVVGTAGACAYLSFFTALRIGPLSVVSPITAAYGGLTVVLAVLFRGESLSLAQVVAVAIATVGVVLAGLVFDGGVRGVSVVGRGVAFAFVALVLFAVMTVGLAGPIGEAGWLPVLLISRLANVGVSVMLLALALSREGDWFAPLLEAPEASSRRAFAIAALAGTLDVAGLVLFGIGLERAETWLVGLASSFGPAVAVLVAVTFLGERLRPSQWAGLVAIAVGLGLVALG
jgi:drug/metabolite transporter (DMT)-like permease